MRVVRVKAGEWVRRILGNSQVTEKGYLGKDGGSGEGDGEERRDVRDGELGDKVNKGKTLTKVSHLHDTTNGNAIH